LGLPALRCYVLRRRAADQEICIPNQEWKKGLCAGIRWDLHFRLLS
jgi:hypothetical protein